MYAFTRYFTDGEFSVTGSRPADGRGAVSVIGQKPLDGRRTAVWNVPFEDDDFLWTAGLVPDDTSADSEGQMRQILEKYEAILASKGLSIKDNCLRTWIFVRDIDNNYSGVVKGRKDYFDGIGLTKETHYIASTGIEGNASDPSVLVTMDAFAVRGIDSRNVKYLQALDRLNPTHEYGVTFERGTAFTHNGHSHIFISGTASIDYKGNVLYIDDVRKQTERAVGNIRALLQDAPAPTRLEDAEQAIVYLRNDADAPIVREALAELVPGLNCIMVHGPVCRPTWLVEIECWF